MMMNNKPPSISLRVWQGTPALFSQTSQSPHVPPHPAQPLTGSCSVGWGPWLACRGSDWTWTFPICLHPRQRSLLKSCRGVGGFDTHHADIRAGANGRDRRFDTHFADNTTSAEMHTIGFIFTYLLQTATAFSSLNRSKLKYLYLAGTRKNLRISSFPDLSYFI